MFRSVTYSQVGWVTCDNASNNTTMLQFFQDKINTNKRRLNSKAGKWAYKNRHIRYILYSTFPFLRTSLSPSRCLAHIINLATQAVIATYSSTAHINVDSSTADVDKTQSDLADIATRFIRDEVGLIRLLAVKARSSAKRTELLKQLQSKEGVQVPLTLILDMKVRWSSTFAMLQRAYDLREVWFLNSCLYVCLLTIPQFINDFVYKISQEEPTAEKQRELLELRVSEDEWNRVKEFLNVLKVRVLVNHSTLYLTQCSMPTPRSTLSPLRPTLPFAMPSLPSSAFTRRGLPS